MLCVKQNMKEITGGWSKEATTQIKGLCAITVVLSHLFPRVQYWGYLSVALFYLFSGYGLFYSLSPKKIYRKFYKKEFGKYYFHF